MINREIAEEFVNTLGQFSDFEISLIDVSGEMIYSTNHKRSSYSALDFSSIMLKENETVEFTSEHQDGIVTAAYVNAHLSIFIVVVGTMKEIRPIIGVLRMAMEIRLKYDETLTQEQKTHSINEHIFQSIIHYDENKHDSVIELFKKGNYQIKLPRSLILIKLVPQLNHELLKDTNFYYDSQEDITAVYKDYILILKDCSKMKTGEQDFYIAEFLHYIKSNTIVQGNCYVSLLQLQIKELKKSYEQVIWLKENLDFIQQQDNDALYYCKDYIDYYLLGQISCDVYANLFDTYKQLNGFDCDEFLELMQVIIKNNYNLAQSSKDLYMHKNTLIYKMEKIKKQFHIDPISVEADRFFLKALYYYICTHKEGWVEPYDG